MIQNIGQNMNPELIALEKLVQARLQEFSIPKEELRILIDILDTSIQLSEAEHFDVPESKVVKLIIGNSGPKAKRKNRRNIKISVGSFLSLTAAGAFTIASAISEPWLIPFVFIILFQEAKKLYEIELDKETALVLYSITRIGRKPSGIKFPEILKSSKYLGQKYGHFLSEKRIKIELYKLIEIGILEKDYLSAYKLIENIEIKFTG